MKPSEKISSCLQCFSFFSQFFHLKKRYKCNFDFKQIPNGSIIMMIAEDENVTLTVGKKINKNKNKNK